MTRWALLIFVALSPGCALFGGGPDESTSPPDPYNARNAPHAVLLVEVVGPNAAHVSLRVLDATGAETFNGNFTVAADATDERAIPITGTGPHRVVVGYAWDASGRGASGSAETTVDAAACAKPVRAHFVIDTTPTHASSFERAECPG